MYFKNREETNIDDEFNNNNILSLIKEVNYKHKLIIIIGVVLIIFGIIILLFLTNKVENYLILHGENNITLYIDSDYIEPGYRAYNSKNEELSTEVSIESNLNTKKTGIYTITYKFGNIIKNRTITIVEKPKVYTFIRLNALNDNINIFIKKGEEYQEPGYQVFSSTGDNLNDEVKITGNVDTSKKGTYSLVYSFIDQNGITIVATRIITVIDTEINLTLSTTEWVNENLKINIEIQDEYFDYLILPNGEIVNETTYDFDIYENGTYTFKTYNKKGIEKIETIEVTNIDKEIPTGSCIVDQNEKGSYITVKANDNAGIKKYEYDGKYYTNNTINLTSYIENANIVIYDKANNTKKVTCTVAPKVFIKEIKKDGVIITVNAQKINNEIAGYYFSYTNERPNKNSGGYIKTNNEQVDVVRLPGTTYVWVEDTVGKISSAKTITIGTDEILITTGSEYKILKGTSLSTYLSNNGWSLEGLNSLIARSVRAAGLYSKEAAATSTLSLLHVLAQKYKIKLPYESAGIYTKIGAKSDWGSSVFNYITDTYVYSGLDCSSFINWAYANAGYGINERAYFWGNMPRVDFSKDNGEIGDILVYGYGEQKGRHVKLIIAKTATSFIITEASDGMSISIHTYSKPNGYKIEKASNLTDLTKNKDFYKLTDYPTGF